MKFDREIVKKEDYYQLKVKPGKEKLKEYYSQKYFQESKGSYQRSYSKKELEYIENQLKFLEIGAKEILNKDVKNLNFLDLGSGEGWAIKYFKKKGCNVKGVDFSSFAIEENNPDMLKYFEQDDIYDFVEKEQKRNNKYDIINLTNIIEHVLEPEALLIDLKNILNENGIVIITFPNDFSPIQNLLLREGKIKEKFWIAVPDHISYFNKTSFDTFAKKLGFNINFYIADFPIDLYLLNEHSNYILDKSKGKEAHLSRLKFMNLICKNDIRKTFTLLKQIADIELGRNLTAFLTL